MNTPTSTSRSALPSYPIRCALYTRIEHIAEQEEALKQAQECDTYRSNSKP